MAWGDESGLRSDAQVGRGFAPAGEIPEIRSYTQRARVNYIASIDNQGTVRFMLYTRKLTAQVFIVFLERLMQERFSKVDPDCRPASGASFSGSTTVACGASASH